MSAWLGAVGAALLGAAIVPQALALARTRRADETTYGFALLNLAGLAFLAMRSAELAEWPFVAINLAGGLFWLAVLGLKLLSHANAVGITSTRAPASSP